MMWTYAVPFDAVLDAVAEGAALQAAAQMQPNEQMVLGLEHVSSFEQLVISRGLQVNDARRMLINEMRGILADIPEVREYMLTVADNVWSGHHPDFRKMGVRDRWVGVGRQLWYSSAGALRLLSYARDVAAGDDEADYVELRVPVPRIMAEAPSPLNSRCGFKLVAPAELVDTTYMVASIR